MWPVFVVQFNSEFLINDAGGVTTNHFAFSLILGQSWCSLLHWKAVYQGFQGKFTACKCGQYSWCNSIPSFWSMMQEGLQLITSHFHLFWVTFRIHFLYFNYILPFIQILQFISGKYTKNWMFNLKNTAKWFQLIVKIVPSYFKLSHQIKSPAHQSQRSFLTPPPPLFTCPLPQAPSGMLTFGPTGAGSLSLPYTPPSAIFSGLPSATSAAALPAITVTTS